MNRSKCKSHRYLVRPFLFKDVTLKLFCELIELFESCAVLCDRDGLFPTYQPRILFTASSHLAIVPSYAFLTSARGVKTVLTLRRDFNSSFDENIPKNKAFFTSRGILSRQKKTQIKKYNQGT